MCRLLAFTSLERKSFYDVVGSDFEKFVALSAEHKDGWGIGYEGEVVKDINPAKESDLLAETGKKLETAGALFHLRLASKGITINIDNNHPFTHGTTTFMHNGTIRPSDTAEQFISQKYRELITGTTDSERFFYAVLSQIDELGLVEGVRKSVNLIREIADYSALNIMVQTPETLIAVCEFNESNQSEWSGPDHYELRFSPREGDFLIASTGWGNSDWEHLNNHQMLVVNRSTLECSISSL
jgi:predicted glutamine amidotransferase